MYSKDMEKILKWCGFEKAHAESDKSVKVWVKGEYTLPRDTDLDMNFFFQYVVPKLEHYDLSRHTVREPSLYAELWINGKMGFGENEDPNLAWQEALVKLIDNG